MSERHRLKSWRSAIDSDGQIYALYCESNISTNKIYFGGQNYYISSGDSSKLELSENATDPYDGVICFTIMAETGIPIISVKDSDTLKFYWVAFESNNASLTDLGSVDLSNNINNINNIAAYKNSSDQTVICFAASMQGETKYLHIETSQNGSSGYSYNEYDLSIFTYNLGNFSLEEISIPEEKVFGNADLCFQSSAAVTDMHIVKESSGSYSLYALVKDEDSHPDVVLTAYDNSDGKYIPAVARGAMLSIDLSSSSITKVYGHNLDSKSDVCALNYLNDEEWLYFTNGFYGPGPSSSSYSAMKSLVGPAKFLAIKPKEITIADYGRKVTATGSKASGDDPNEQDVAATASRFSGKAIFSISSKDLTFNDTESFKISAQRTSESGLTTATYPYMDTNETDFSVLYLTPNAETLY